jgi:S-(hydroxymethyl)glutathione dehydrogenase / alcohol dehydrogenase
MCHSDYHPTTGATPIGLPALGGHEGAGVVTKVGKGVTGIAEGDHVILAFIPACGQCPPCLKGFRSLCDRGAVLLGGKAIADGTCRVRAGSHDVSPMNLLGTFAPYMTVHKDSVVKIDPAVPFESAAILGCAVPTGFGSATNVAHCRALCSPAPSTSSRSIRSSSNASRPSSSAQVIIAVGEMRGEMVEEAMTLTAKTVPAS